MTALPIACARALMPMFKNSLLYFCARKESIPCKKKNAPSKKSNPLFINKDLNPDDPAKSCPILFKSCLKRTSSFHGVQISLKLNQTAKQRFFFSPYLP
jgi:hypothetical protein